MSWEHVVKAKWGLSADRMSRLGEVLVRMQLTHVFRKPISDSPNASAGLTIGVAQTKS
jgi:hypothetical protein